MMLLHVVTIDRWLARNHQESLISSPPLGKTQKHRKNHLPAITVDGIQTPLTKTHPEPKAPKFSFFHLDNLIFV